MSLPGIRAKTSEIAYDGKMPFTVHLDVTPFPTFAVAIGKNKRAAFIAPCDCTVLQAFLACTASKAVGATYRLKIGSATVGTWTGTLAKVLVSGQKFGGTNQDGATTSFIDLLATTAGLTTGWPKATTNKRQLSRGQVVVFLTTYVAASVLGQTHSVMLVCAPR